MNLCGLTDVPTILNQALGTAPPVNNLKGGGTLTVVDIQIEIDAALGETCFAQ